MSFLLVPLAMFGWVIVMTLLFYAPPKSGVRGVILIAVIGGTLYLPVSGYSVISYIVYSKNAAIALSASIGILLFGRKEPIRTHLSLIDLPMLGWCLVPILTCIVDAYGTSQRRYFHRYPAVHRMGHPIPVGATILLQF